MDTSSASARFPSIRPLIAEASDSLNLNSEADLDGLLRMAENLLTHCPEVETLREFEAEFANTGPLSLAVAAKLALSKALVGAASKPGFVSVVFAVYKEHNRIRKPEEHPHGEDFLTRKIHQLRWLFENTDFGWEVIVVDDGCPEGSGKIAEEIIRESDYAENARVFFLEDAIARGTEVAAGLASTADSQKGGAILYGIWEALKEERDNHVVLYTDADLSTHLGQIGLLLKPMENPGTAAAIGSRREPSSVVVKVGTRNTRGKLFIYLWKRLISVLPDVIDTQCAFKAFRADVARQILAPAIERKFAFDIELLVKVALADQGRIQNVPLAWIDSEAASTTTDLEPYLPMLQSIVRIQQTYLPESAAAAPFAELIKSLDADAWDRLCDHVPAAIAESEPFELGSDALVSADDLRAIAFPS